MDEFALIKQLTKQFDNSSQNILVGIGDDAAVCKFPAGHNLVMTSDMMVDGKHFLLNKMPAQSLGYKLVAISVSDIAAMGGYPLYLTISLAVPPKVSSSYLEGIYQGIAQACSKWNLSLVGGDTVSSSVLTLDATVVGAVKLAKHVCRAGANPGDLIGVTGTLGDSAAGLECLLQDHQRPYCGYLVEKHVQPNPHVNFAVQLANMGLATGFNDVSDGLASELHEICEASGVGAEIHLSKIPLSTQIKQAEQDLNHKATEWALFGGEDYQLLFTCSPANLPIIKETSEELGVNFTIIGRITRPLDVKIVMDNKRVQLPKGGYNHFKPSDKPDV